MKCSLVCLVAQLCLTLCDPVDCSPPGSSVHGLLRNNTGVGCHFLLQGTFPTEGLNSCLLHCRQTFFVFLPLNHQGSPNIPLISPVFWKDLFLKGLSHSIVFLYFFQLGTFSYLSLLFFGTQHSVGYIFPILLCLSLLFFSQVFVRASQMIILPSCISFSLWWFWSLPPVQRYKPLSIVLQALCLPDLIPWICCYPNYSLFKDPALEFLRYIVYICNLLCSNSLSLNSSLAFHRFAFLFFCLHFELNTLFSKFLSFV